MRRYALACLGFACLIVLAACSHATPMDLAITTVDEYTAASTAAKNVIVLPSTNATTKACVKFADQVAFDYVTSTKEQAEAWNNAPDDNTKDAKLIAFNSILDSAQKNLGGLTTLLTNGGHCPVGTAPPLNLTPDTTLDGAPLTPVVPTS